jgi:hypothetical protein
MAVSSASIVIGPPSTRLGLTHAPTPIGARAVVGTSVGEIVGAAVGFTFDDAVGCGSAVGNARPAELHAARARTASTSLVRMSVSFPTTVTC